jgi:hypothetical protein
MPPRKLNTTKTTKRKSRTAVVMDAIPSGRDNTICLTACITACRQCRRLDCPRPVHLQADWMQTAAPEEWRK